MTTIIGREEEIETLSRLYNSRNSEFVALYGRRRVGKSYLVKEFFKNKILFTAVGTYVKDDNEDYESYRRLQLSHFYDALILAGLDSSNASPKNWREAFLLLMNRHLSAKTANKAAKTPKNRNFEGGVKNFSYICTITDNSACPRHRTGEK